LLLQTTTIKKVLARVASIVNDFILQYPPGAGFRP
jgi:hypothetical protein